MMEEKVEFCMWCGDSLPDFRRPRKCDNCLAESGWHSGDEHD